MPALKPDHVEPTSEEDARLDELIASDPEDSAHWDARAPRPASEVIPKIVDADRRGTLRILGASPGATLKGVLIERGISQLQLATLMGRPPNAVTDIIHSKQAITARTALELEDALSIPAQYWLHMEADYRLALERERRDRSRSLS